MENKVVLYHGSPNDKIIPTYGLGESRHDYGKGFYLTENIDLAKEWAVCNPSNISGWVHKYDVIKGWRANASYFYIAKAFVRDEIDIEILEELLSLGSLGIQYCVKTEKAYSKLWELSDELISVDYSEFNEKYNARDVAARDNMRKLINSDKNKVTNVFSTLI